MRKHESDTILRGGGTSGDGGRVIHQRLQRKTHLVFLQDLAERYDLCVCEAREGVDVIAAMQKVALIAGEATVESKVL